MVKKRFGTAVRQDQIAEAALDIVAREGIRALNVAAVAEKVGIVPSAVYRHYKNKGAIVSAVIQQIRARLNKNFQSIDELEIDPVEKLHLLLNRHIEMIAGNHAIPRILFSEEVIGGMPDKQGQLYDLIQNVIGNVSTIVSDGQRKYLIRRDMPANHIAVSFLGMIQPAAIIWSLSNGAFDLILHSQHAWQLFSDAVRIAGRKKSS